MASDRHRAADALRRLIPLVAYSQAPDEEICGASESLEAVVARLEPFAAPSRHVVHGGIGELTGYQPELWDAHPIVGPSNGMAPPVQVVELGDVVEGRGSFGASYEGAPGTVQGGFLALTFDYVLGRQAALCGAPVVTGTLTVRYESPTLIDQEVVFRASCDRIDGRKVLVRGVALQDEHLRASGEATFISVDRRRFEWNGT